MMEKTERAISRRRAGILFIFICAAITVSYFGIQNWTASIQKSACERANDVRRESNDRIGAHVEDEDNLIALSKALTHTRAVEATAWQDLNLLIIHNPINQHATGERLKVFKQSERDIKDLIIAYRLARARDSAIAAREKTIHFDKLVIVNCKKVV
jgi:hypothetical protein